MTSTSLVLELQRIAQESGTGITELLRRAKVVATKLRLDEARQWIDLEINGYSSTVNLPKYRIIPSELQYKNSLRGWIPVSWDPGEPLHLHFSEDHLTTPIAEIERLAESGSKGVRFRRLDQSEIDILLRCGNPQLLVFRVARVYSASALVRVIEAVRIKILEFALELEQRGVLGEGMTFNETEKRVATNVTFNVGSVGTLVQGDHAHAPSSTNSPGANIDQTSFSAGQAGAQGKHAVASSNTIKQGASSMSPETKRTAVQELKRLRMELTKRLNDAADAIIVGRVGEAEAAAARGDYEAMIRNLRSLEGDIPKVITKLKLVFLATITANPDAVTENLTSPVTAEMPTTSTTVRRSRRTRGKQA